MKQFTMQIEACEGMDAAAHSNRLLHLNSWFYFLILIDELLAIAAGDYLLKGEKKFGINSEGNRSYLDVLAAHIHKQKPGHNYIKGGILNPASILEDYSSYCQKEPGFGAWQEEDTGM
jgi:hypothetical protein